MKERLKSELKEAMKAREQVKMDTIRGLLAALQYEEIQKGVEALPDEAAVAVLKTELKKRKEELEFGEKAARSEMIDKLKIEMAVLESFLPAQMSADAIEKLLVDLKAKNSALNMGAAMKMLKDSYAGQYDGKLASEIAKKILG